MSKAKKVEPTQESFLSDVAKHVMTIARNDGTYRHVIFAKPGSYHMRFELVTWPGYLCYSGDMGTYVFHRLPDMFEFFREKNINPDYWSEKVESQDRDGVREWSEERFKEVIESYLENDGEPLPDGVREAVNEDVLSRVGDGQHEAYRAASEFEHSGFQFNDLWDHRFDEFTFRFVWCCYALVWGIQEYDKTESGARL